MITIVIPYVHSKWMDIEIRFALRSAERHLHGFANIVIVGDMPKGIVGVDHIPHLAETRPQWKERNIYDRVLFACEDGRVTQNFLFMNDDHFLLSEYQANEFPNYYGQWPDHNGGYQHTLSNSRDICTRFFDVHCPILINKDRFKRTVTAMDWNKKYGYCMKSVYAKGLPETECQDLKIRYQYPVGELRRMIAGRDWFSMCDHARGPDMERFLKELYPDKSKYEL